MSPFLAGVVRAVAEALPLPAPIVQLGSYLGTSAAPEPNLRLCFPGRPFCGIDLRPGLGVDLVSSFDELPLADRAVGTLLAVNCLGQVRRLWEALGQIRRVLRTNGAVLVAMPFERRLQDQAADCWRFTPEGLDYLLQDYPQRIVGYQGAPRRPLAVWCAAFGREFPPISPAQMVHFRRCLERFVRDPLTLGERVRLRFTRLVAGRRAVRHVLDRNRWSCEYRGPNTASALAA